MVSVIISWRDRLELKQALPSITAAADAVGGDVTIVNYGGSLDLLHEQVGRLADDVTIVDVERRPYFNKSCAQNIGAAHSRHPVLFFCDCDIIIRPDVLQDLHDRVTERPASFATVARVTETTVNARGANHIVCFGYELRIRTADNRLLVIVDNEEDAEDGTRQAPGLLMARRRDFESVNGYNSQLHGWGWEDQDMIARLVLGGGLERMIHGSVTHISHDDDARTRFYPLSDRWESRDRMFRQALANYDRGRFQGTWRRDVTDHQTDVRSRRRPALATVEAPADPWTCGTSHDDRHSSSEET